MSYLTSPMEIEIFGDFDRNRPRAFATPWAARAFGLVLASFDKRLFTAKDFQEALIGRIELREREHGPIDSDEIYYSCWLEALGFLLLSRDVVDQAQLKEAEVVVRERLRALEHEHTHKHKHKHEDDHDHDHDHDDDHGRVDGQAKVMPVPIYREKSK